MKKLLLSIIILLSGCAGTNVIYAPPLVVVQEKMTVHFLDVGQADSILTELPNGEIMLIDAGNNADGDFVVKYLEDLGLSKIDYFIGTHPHEDHIGGADTVIRAFDIGNIYMPKVAANTKTFRDVITAIDEKGYSVNTAKAGVSILDTEVGGVSLTASLAAPNSDEYKNLNDYSAVLLLCYGDTAFLFTGDAEDVSEKEMENIQADVLKIGHHGSVTSTTEEFLDKVNPKYAVISCGAGNSYGHPAPETLEKLAKKGIIVYRTDELGTIIITSDSAELTESSSRDR